MESPLNIMMDRCFICALEHSIPFSTSIAGKIWDWELLVSGLRVLWRGLTIVSFFHAAS